MGFPPVPSKGMVIAVVTPVSATTKLAVKFPIAVGVKVMYIWQLWPPEIVPTQENPSKAKLALFVPLIVMLDTLTAFALELLRKMSKGEPVELRGTVPNWIGFG